ncbi:MAG: hypothetical protein MZU97_09135 [Bacillus subtilis]|nr:hypothetical protein [Bacillus subtilis]
MNGSQYGNTGFNPYGNTGFNPYGNTGYNQYGMGFNPYAATGQMPYMMLTQFGTNGSGDYSAMFNQMLGALGLDNSSSITDLFSKLLSN